MAMFGCKRVSAKIGMGGRWLMMTWVVSSLMTTTQAGQPPSEPARNPEPARLVAKRVPADPNQQMAVVNGEAITRAQLSHAAVSERGLAMLDDLISRRLIRLALQEQGLEVTPEEIQTFIDYQADEVAQVGRSKFFEILQNEQGISPIQYTQHIVAPRLGLRKLAQTHVTVSDAEVDQAFEAKFGVKVVCRAIMIEDMKKARDIWMQLRKGTSSFAELAQAHSVDASTAGLGGLMDRPILRFSEPEAVSSAIYQQLVDGLTDAEGRHQTPLDGAFTTPLQIDDQMIAIFQRDHLISPDTSVDRQDPKLRQQMREVITESKLQRGMGQVYERLEREADIRNLLSGRTKPSGQLWAELETSELAEQPPAPPRNPQAAVAMINDHPITRDELASAVILKEGPQILQNLINRKLIDQKLKAKGFTVAQEEVDAFIDEQAQIADPPLSRDQFLRVIAQGRKISPEQYIQHVVYPNIGLRKLAAERVEIDQEDLKHAFQSLYGERIRCRVIMVDSLNKAQNIWNSLRQDPAGFPDLARRFSIDPATRALGGMINDPIHRHSNPRIVTDAIFEQLVDGVARVGILDSVEQMPAYKELYGSTKPTDGDFTGPVQLNPTAWAIFRREELLAPNHSKSEDDPKVQAQLREVVLKAKTNVAVALVFEEIEKGAEIQNLLTGLSKPAGEVPDNEADLQRTAAEMSEIKSNLRR